MYLFIGFFKNINKECKKGDEMTHSGNTFLLCIHYSLEFPGVPLITFVIFKTVDNFFII